MDGEVRGGILGTSFQVELHGIIWESAGQNNLLSMASHIENRKINEEDLICALNQEIVICCLWDDTFPASLEGRNVVRRGTSITLRESDLPEFLVLRLFGRSYPFRPQSHQ